MTFIVKLSIVVLCLPVFFSISGCKTCSCKKITCAAFNDAAFDKWAPYKEGELLVFKNQLGVADTIRITGLRKSDAYESTSGGGYGCGKGCYTSGTAYGTDMQGNNFEKFSFNVNKSDPNGNSVPQIVNVSLRLKNLFINAKSLTDTGLNKTTGFNEVTFYTKFSSSVTVLSKNFSNVQTLLLDTAIYKFNGPFKVYLAADKGLVAWETYPDKTVWVRE
jgi:hypothetical protein